MRDNLIPDGTTIPIPDNRRVSTDVLCTIIGALFALTLFVLACIFYSSGKPALTQVPSTRPISTSPALTELPLKAITTVLSRLSGLLSLPPWDWA